MFKTFFSFKIFFRGLMVILMVFGFTACIELLLSPVDIDTIPLPAPVPDGTPVANFETDQYTGTVTWSPRLARDGTFLDRMVYTAKITLDPIPGYTLSNVSANFFRVVGATSVSNNAGSGEITAVFPETSYTAISILDLPLPAPVAGGAPVRDFETYEYTGTVEWSSPFAADGTFRERTLYSAWINLSPKPGFTLDGVGLNSFRVDGATSVTAGIDYIEAIYWPPGVRTITVLELPVPPPVTGATAVTKFETLEYTGTVDWIDGGSFSGTFKPGTKYTAVIKLTPKPGYTLRGVRARTFRIAGKRVAHQRANSGYIQADFSTGP